MRAVVILIDTLCRRFLPPYGGAAILPNYKRAAARSAVFDNHWVGSAPCMPARRDLFTGRLNFLERNWGGAEPFDHLLPELLRAHGVYCHLVSDHAHYCEVGGEGYINGFDSWEMIRGQETDAFGSSVRAPECPPHVGLMRPQYLRNRKRWTEEAGFPTPVTFAHAADWLRENEDADDYLLWVEGFDPHEPFDVPQGYLDLYDDDYTGELFFWPEYAHKEYTPEQTAHIRRRYQALASMTDRWLGRVLDELERQGRWEDTLIVLTTDHGFMLGEHGFYGKNYMPAYNEVFHIPLLVHLPGQTQSRRIPALTQNIDLFPTLLQWFGVPLDEARNPIHGKSLLPLLQGTCETLREAAIYGNYGMSVNVTDGRYAYFRAAVRPDNQPLYLYGVSPGTLRQRYGIHTVRDPRTIECGRYLPWTDYPVLRIPAEQISLQGIYQNFDRRNDYNAEHMLFDLSSDYAQAHPLCDPAQEARMAALLCRAMQAHDAPPEQYERLGLTESGPA